MLIVAQLGMAPIYNKWCLENPLDCPYYYPYGGYGRQK